MYEVSGNHSIEIEILPLSPPTVDHAYGIPFQVGYFRPRIKIRG